MLKVYFLIAPLTREIRKRTNRRENRTQNRNAPRRCQRVLNTFRSFGHRNLGLQTIRRPPRTNSSTNDSGLDQITPLNESSIFGRVMTASFTLKMSPLPRTRIFSLSREGRMPVGRCFDLVPPESVVPPLLWRRILKAHFGHAETHLNQQSFIYTHTNRTVEATRQKRRTVGRTSLDANSLI